MQGQLSIFEFLRVEIEFNPIEALALCGTGFQDGMTRVRNYFSEDHSIADKVSFLKKEYGIGGFSNITPKPFLICAMDTIGLGKSDINFEYCDENMKIVKTCCSWKQLAETITDMVVKGNYKR